MIQSSLNDIITVKDSLLHGKGIFSTKNILEGQIITQIKGEMISAEECIKREEEGNVYIFWKEDDLYIDVSNHSIIRFINHSCDYNCDVDEDESGNLILLAIRDITEGEELTIDYGYEEIYENCTCTLCASKKLAKED